MEIENMTLRQVADATKKISIADGGLEILINKIVMEIENLQKKTAVIFTLDQIKGE